MSNGLRLGWIAALASAIGALIAPLSSHAQPKGVVRVAVLSQGSEPAAGTAPGSIAKSLAALGYVEGRNLVLDRRWASGDSSRFPAFAADVVALKPNVIVAETTPGALAAKAATSTIPIVFYNVTDPVGTKLVADIARPGGNVTGISDFGTEGAVKALELLHAIVPGASRVGVLMSDNPVHALVLRELRKAAGTMGVTMVPLVAGSAGEFDSVFAAMRKTDAAIMLGGPPYSGREHARRVAELQQKSRLPIACTEVDCVHAGGLIGFFPAMARGKAVAAYVDKILRGALPGDLPVQQPTKFEVVVSNKAARQLGLTIPPAVQLRANRVID
jgi:putative ABC transport system substrate-binding protein